MEPSAADLAARAAARHVVVIGGGVGGLVAARTFAKVGMSVTVLEEAERLGGTIRHAMLDGLAVEVGADSFAASGRLRELIDELGLTGEVTTPDATQLWVGGLPGGRTAPHPARSILGIPDNPFAEDVRRIIGWRGAWRAYLDRLRPPLTIGHEQALGRLVTTRMGVRVRDRLVAPLAEGVFAISPDDIDTEVAAPGLNAALTRVGSLSGAVSTLLAERDASPALSLAGGMTRLVDALAAELELLGATMQTGARALALTREGERWSTRVAASGDEEERTISSDAVVIATDDDSARTLLESHLALPELPPAAPVEVVTLLVKSPALRTSPRGAGVVTVPGSGPVRSLSHQNAKWHELGEPGGDRHVLRVLFGTLAHPPATAALTDSEAAAVALREACALLGIGEDAIELVDAHRDRFTQPPPASALGAAERRARVRAAAASVAGIGIVGAWVAGTGLAQVVPDAEAEAERIRHELLWETPDVSPPAPEI